MPQFKEVFEPMGADAEGSGDVRNTEWLMNVMEQHCIENGGALTVGELVEAVARLLCSKSNSDAIQVFCQPVCVCVWVHRSHRYTPHIPAGYSGAGRTFDSGVLLQGELLDLLAFNFDLTSELIQHRDQLNKALKKTGGKKSGPHTQVPAPHTQVHLIQAIFRSLSLHEIT